MGVIVRRLYPAWTEATKHLFVSEKDIPLRKVGDHFTAPYVFNTNIPLLGKNTESLTLHPGLTVETFYVYIRELGIVAIDVYGKILKLGIVSGHGAGKRLICTRLTLDVPGVTDASILISLLGSMNFNTGVIEFEPTIITTTGLESEPIMLGYDVVLRLDEEEVVA
jgi:hypothetical protein